jgi:hypothetical protein
MQNTIHAKNKNDTTKIMKCQNNLFIFDVLVASMMVLLLLVIVVPLLIVAVDTSKSVALVLGF